MSCRAVMVAPSASASTVPALISFLAMATSSCGCRTIATSVRAKLAMGASSVGVIVRADSIMTAQRLVVALAAWLVTAGLAVTPVRGADAPDLRCGQEPGTRFFWTEWGFCDLEPHGPEKARGLVIWNHGISGTEVQYKAPPALAMRLLHARGWDIIKLNRNNLGGTTSPHLALARLKERNEAEIRVQLARGYRRVVLAGQSFGGYAALEAAAGSRD